MKKDETSTADRGFLKTTTVPPRSGKPDSGNGAVKTQPRNRKDSANKPLDGNIEKETTPGSRAAKLMLLLGREEAAAVMARLNPEEAEEVARQIAATSRVDSVEARELLDEFGDRFSDLEVRRGERRVGCGQGNSDGCIRLRKSGWNYCGISPGITAPALCFSQ